MFKNILEKIKNKKGFNLVELSAVVLIIAILATVALPKYTNVIENANISEALENLEQIRAKQDYFHSFNGEYETSFTNLDIGIRGTVSGSQLTTDKFQYTLFASAARAKRLSSVGYVLYFTNYETPNINCSCTESSEPDKCQKVCNNLANMIN